MRWWKACTGKRPRLDGLTEKGAAILHGAIPRLIRDSARRASASIHVYNRGCRPLPWHVEPYLESPTMVGGMHRQVTGCRPPPYHAEPFSTPAMVDGHMVFVLTQMAGPRSSLSKFMDLTENAIVISKTYCISKFIYYVISLHLSCATSKLGFVT